MRVVLSVIMGIVQSWKDSLSIFRPKNFKLFMLVTFKAIVETYKTLFYSCWLLGFGFMGLFIAISLLPAPYVLVNYLLRVLFLFVLLLSVRPSVKRKTYAYYMDYGWHFFYYWCAIIMISYSLLFCFTLMVLFFKVNASWFKYFNSVIPFNSITVPFSVCFPLFLLDSDASFRSVPRSVVRGFKMVFYNYPFYFVVHMASWLAYVIISDFLLVHVNYGHYGYTVLPILYMFLLPIPLCFFTNFYVKRLHEQFTLYFGNNR